LIGLFVGGAQARAVRGGIRILALVRRLAHHFLGRMFPTEQIEDVRGVGEPELQFVEIELRGAVVRREIGGDASLRVAREDRIRADLVGRHPFVGHDAHQPLTLLLRR